MSYKYFIDKIEDSHAFISRMTFIAAELGREERLSEIIEDFQSEEPKNICKILNWRDAEEVHESIKSEIDDNSFVWFMSQHSRDGFLAEISIPICSNFSFREDGTPSSWLCSNGYCRIEWIYADTIGELAEKVIEIGGRTFDEFVKEAKETMA